MRVLFCRMNGGYNGVTGWLDDLGTELKARGIDVCYWFGVAPPARIAAFERIGQTRVGSAAALVSALEHERYDIVHVHTADGMALAPTLLDKDFRLVATNHASVSRLWNSRNCHALSAVSAGAGALEQSHTDLAVEVIYNSIDTNRFGLADERRAGAPIVAYVGRTTGPDARAKNFARFTRIAAVLASQGVRIWVADGSGRQPDYFTAPEFAPVPYDRWGRFGREEMADLYRTVAASGGAVLMTSRYEAFPLVPLEAAACGAGTLGPDVLGVQEAIRPDWGAIFAADASDADVARLVLDWLAANPPSKARFAARANAVAEQFPLARMVDRYVEIYQRPTPKLASETPINSRPLPSGAKEVLEDAFAPRWRHQAYWAPLARELGEMGEHRLSVRAARRAIRYDPGIIKRPRDAANLLRIFGRASRGLLRRER